jgi:galactonate dehydratase
MNATGDIGWLDCWSKVDELVERLGSVRATGINVGVDFHGRVHKPMGTADAAGDRAVAAAVRRRSPAW